MRKLVASFGLNLVFFFSVLFPAQSESLSLVWPVEGRLGLKFGEKYQAGGEEKTHLGVDILAAEGSEIKSPVDGEVSFAGQVAGRLAVTIGIEGYKVSLSPLQEILVLKGEKVGAGKVIGKLAAEGDYSSTEPHLHLSLRDPSGKYLDPLPFFLPLTEKEQFQEHSQPQIQEQPVSNQIVVNLEFVPEIVEVPNINQVPDQAEVNQLPKGIQEGSSALKPGLKRPLDSQLLLGQESLPIQAMVKLRSFKRANLKNDLSSFCSKPGAGIKNKHFFSVHRETQLQLHGLTELAQFSSLTNQAPLVKSKDNISFNLDNFLSLGQSFLLLFLVYFLFCLAERKFEPVAAVG